MTEEWQKNYEVRVSVKRDRGRPRLTFENTVSMIIDHDDPAEDMYLWRGKNIYKKRSTPFFLTTYPARDKAIAASRFTRIAVRQREISVKTYYSPYLTLETFTC